MKLFTKLIASAAVFITMSCCFALSAQAYDPVPIDEEHFPDKALRMYVTANFDKDKDKILSDEEISKAAIIQITDNSEVSSADGLQYLPELVTLKLKGVEGTIDLSQNSKLEVLSLVGDFKALDLSTCPNIKELHIFSLSLAELDIDDLTELNDLNITAFMLNDIDLSHNTKLTKLWLGDLFSNTGDITGQDNYTVTHTDDDDDYVSTNAPMHRPLDLSGNPELTNLNLSHSGFDSIDLSNCSKLEYINISGINVLNTLDLNSCTELLGLTVTQCSDLTSLAFDKCSKLENIDIENVCVTQLDLSTAPSLKSFTYATAMIYSDVPIENINFGNCGQLTQLSLTGSKLTSLDLSNCTQLTTVDISDNLSLNNIKLNCKDTLKSLTVNTSSLYRLDLTDYSSLTYLSCYENLLSELVISGCTELQTLYCSNNALTKLDLSNSPQLYDLDCTSNHITSIDITQCKYLMELTEEHVQYNEGGIISYHAPLSSDDGETVEASLAIDNDVLYNGEEETSDSVQSEQPAETSKNISDSSKSTIPKGAAIGILGGVGAAAIAAIVIKIVRSKKKDDDDGPSDDAKPLI